MGNPQQDADSQRKPSAIDIHVGSRVRMRRMLLGISQEKLGKMLGLTFQQVQKYEKGTNRIGASRLFEIAGILSVPVQYFFDEAPDLEGQKSKSGSRAKVQSDGAGKGVVSFLGSREGIELNRAFMSISKPKVRKSIIELVRSLADEDA